MREIKEIIVHCSASEFGNVDRIREWHTSAPRNWSDIGYHYVINNGVVHKGEAVGTSVEDGFIEEGRELNRVGAHCRGHNRGSIGICLIGDKEFTAKQMQALRDLVKGLQDQFGLSDKDVHGHYEYSSKTCPNFDVAEALR